MTSAHGEYETMLKTYSFWSLKESFMPAFIYFS